MVNETFYGDGLIQQISSPNWIFASVACSNKENEMMFLEKQLYFLGCFQSFIAFIYFVGWRYLKNFKMLSSFKRNSWRKAKTSIHWKQTDRTKDSVESRN